MRGVVLRTFFEGDVILIEYKRLTENELDTFIEMRIAQLHRKHELFVAALYTAAVIMFSVTHIYDMISSSTIL